MNITIKTKNNNYSINEYGHVRKLKKNSDKVMTTFESSILYKEKISEIRIIKSVLKNMLAEKKFYNCNEIENKIYSGLKLINTIEKKTLSRRYKILK